MTGEHVFHFLTFIIKVKQSGPGLAVGLWTVSWTQGTQEISGNHEV